MIDYTTSKLELLVKFFNNIFHKQRLIIFIGIHGTTLATLKWEETQDSIYVEHDDKKRNIKCHDFINKYNKHHISFLLDTKECVLKHETMPIFSSLIKMNPVDKFIAENYEPSDIVAHNVYSIDNHHGEIWNSCIASTPCQEPVRHLIEYVINSSLKYSGCYFLSLEFQTIINKILKKTQRIDLIDDLQIFVTITKSSDIRIVVKYKKDIMNEQVIEYPHDKSEMYVIGTIEQAVSDKILFYKEYINKLKLQSCVILLLNKKLKKLAKDLVFGDSKIILLSGDDITTSENYEEKEFQDHILIERFSSSNTHLALNKSLKSVTKLALIDSAIFKPLTIMILAFSVILATIKYKDITIKSETLKLNQQYYALSDDYREVQQRHPGISNINDLVDLYNLEDVIRQVSLSPFQHLKNILSFDKSELQITNITWATNHLSNISIPEKNLSINIELMYKSDDKLTSRGLEILNEYTNHIRFIFQDYDVVFTQDINDISYVARNILIPAHISIKGKIKDNANAR